MKSKAAHPFPVEHSLAVVVILLLVSCIVVDLIAIVVDGGRVFFSVTEADEATNALIQGIPALAQLAAYLTTGILFLVWLYRVHRNLPALGVRRAKYSPGWAVGWFFVPIVNLVLPYDVVKELWKDSNPDAGMSDAFFEQHPEATRQYSSKSSLIGFWWGCWIAALVANRVYVTLLSHPGEDRLEAASWVGSICDCLGILGAACAIFIVKEIDAGQEEKRRRLISDHDLQSARAAAQSGNH